MADAGEGPGIVKKDDSFLALSILFVAVVGVIVSLVYLYRNKKLSTFSDHRLEYLA